MECRTEGNTPESICQGIRKSFKIIEDDQHACAVLLSACDFSFFSPESADTALKICHAVSGCKVPVIAVTDGVTDTPRILAGLCSDIMILSEESRYQYRAEDLKGILSREQQTALLSRRFGPGFATKWVSHGLDCTGRELKVRGMTAQIMAKSDVTAAVEALVSPLIQTEKSALQLLKQHLKQDVQSVLTGDLRNVSLYDQESSGETDPLQQSVTDILSYKDLSAEERVPESYGTSVEVSIESDVMTLKQYPDGVLLVRMCDKESKNTFSERFTEGMARIFDHVRANDEYKAVILTGYDSYSTLKLIFTGFQSLSYISI